MEEELVGYRLKNSPRADRHTVEKIKALLVDRGARGGVAGGVAGTDTGWAGVCGGLQRSILSGGLVGDDEEGGRERGREKTHKKVDNFKMIGPAHLLVLIFCFFYHT